MGPPKLLKQRIKYSELKRRWDYFEYRWNDNTGSYFFFNPYTGETIIQQEHEMLDRTKSLWGKPDLIVVPNALIYTFMPEVYLSKLEFPRAFNKPYGTKEKATIYIQAVARGMLARLNYAKIMNQRYIIKFDNESHYYYYCDLWNEHAEPSWYKPRLAFPGEIEEFHEYDKEDYLQGHKFSYNDYAKGPYVMIDGLGKNNVVLAEGCSDAFMKHNHLREIAYRHPKEIELDKFPIGTIMAWFDGQKVIPHTLDDYTVMRAAIDGENWDRTLKWMKEYSEYPLIQAYGWYSFSKTRVPLSPEGLLDFAAATVLVESVDLLVDLEKYADVPQLTKIMAFHALSNILAIRAGRAEYLSTESVTEIGDARAEALEAFITKKLTQFNFYLLRVHHEEGLISKKEDREFTKVMVPSSRGVDLAQCALKVINVISREQDIREQMAFTMNETIVRCLNICQEDATCMLYGLQILYNFCYRCESGQEAVLMVDIHGTLKLAHFHHSGDPEVARMIRRLELAIKENGWRGHVENLIEREMEGVELDPMYLVDIKKVNDDDDLPEALKLLHVERKKSDKIFSEQIEIEYEDNDDISISSRVEIELDYDADNKDDNVSELGDYDKDHIDAQYESKSDYKAEQKEDKEQGFNDSKNINEDKNYNDDDDENDDDNDNDNDNYVEDKQDDNDNNDEDEDEDKEVDHDMGSIVSQVTFDNSAI